MATITIKEAFEKKLYADKNTVLLYNNVKVDGIGIEDYCVYHQIAEDECKEISGQWNYVLINYDSGDFDAVKADTQLQMFIDPMWLPQLVKEVEERMEKRIKDKVDEVTAMVNIIADEQDAMLTVCREVWESYIPGTGGLSFISDEAWHSFQTVFAKYFTEKKK